SLSDAFATTNAPTVENGVESTIVAESARATMRPVAPRCPWMITGVASGTIAPRMPALDANADVTAATTQISKPTRSGLPKPAIEAPTASMVPYRCSAATYVTMPQTSRTTPQAMFFSAPSLDRGNTRCSVTAAANATKPIARPNTNAATATTAIATRVEI